jgi:hypothetical protein
MMMLCRNNIPQANLSTEGITFRDGTVLYWDDIYENTYYESDYGNADGITIKSNQMKRTITMPDLNAKKYLALCDHYSNSPTPIDK